VNTKEVPIFGDKPRFEHITEHVGIYHDVVNVGVIRSRNRTLLIDSGDASILKAAKDLHLGSIDTVLYTHYHRDQCSGAPLLRMAHLNVPASEARFFRDATDFWLEADAILDHRYNFRPEIMVLRESVAIDRELHDGEILHWEGIPICVVATPGHTDGSLSYVVNVDGETIAFTGDLVYGPGQIWEFYSLQKRFPGMADDYWGFGGAVPDLLASGDVILSHKPTILVPSHGKVIRNPQEAIHLVQSRLVSVMQNYFTLCPWRVARRNGVPMFKEDPPPPFNVSMLAELPSVQVPDWLHRTVGTSTYIVAKDKSIFLFDCGFAPIVGALDELVKKGRISAVDAIWASHYHDDHVASINEVRRKYGAKLFVQREMVDIFEHPEAYCMPCSFPESIHVDHVLTDGETFQWKEYRLTAYYFPGQTLYHAGLLIEYKGTRVFMSGDAFGNWAIGDVCSYNRNFVGKDGEVAGCARCLKLLRELKPDLLCAAHWGPIPISPDYIEKTLQLLQEREETLNRLLPWEDPNFGLDPYWIRAYPYRQDILPGQSITLEVCIFNHADSHRHAMAQLRVPHGWDVKRADGITISGHAEERIRLSALAPERPSARREVLGVVVQFGDRNLGEVAETIVNYLEPVAVSAPYPG
jgi:glyoxylase-like metal-dependent hydrolase (beta-lactamase superfamily II)